MTNQTVRAIQKFLLLELHTKICRLYVAESKKLTEITTPLADAAGNPLQGFPLDCIEPDDKVKEAVSAGDLNSAYLDHHMRHFFEIVHKELVKIVHERQLPVVVIGVTKNISLFQEIERHTATQLLTGKDAIIGYKDAAYSKQDELLQAGLALVKEYEAAHVQAVLKKFFEAEGSLHQAFGARRVWLMAHEGRIDTLLVEEGFTIPGKVDPDNKDHLLIGMGTHNIIDAIIERTCATGGAVIFVKPGTLKEYEHIGAILRY